MAPPNPPPEYYAAALREMAEGLNGAVSPWPASSDACAVLEDLATALDVVADAVLWIVRSSRQARAGADPQSAERWAALRGELGQAASTLVRADGEWV